MRCIIFLLKKDKVWIWKMLCHHTQKLLGWYCGDRSAASLEQLMTKFNLENIEHVYADHWKAYRQFLPQLTQSKKNTHQIERNNGQQRHWLGRFKRRSIVVTRSLKMLEISLWLFARFRVNGDIYELTSLLR